MKVTKKKKTESLLRVYEIKMEAFKSVMVNLFYSDINGVKLSTGNDEPKVIKKEPKKEFLRNSCY